MVRAAGTIDSAQGFTRHDHVCWIFDRRADFTNAAIEFLAEGLELGDRVAYVGSEPRDVLRRHLDALGDVDALQRDRRLDVVSIADMYAPGRVGGPAEQAATYAAASAAAVADGFDGLRVAAEATQLVREARKRHTFLRYEHLVDRAMSSGVPFTAMCGYDRTQLGDAADELACVHPLRRGANSPFSVHATGNGAFAIAGEADALCAHTLARVLEHVVSGPGDGAELEVDCRSLTFVDQRAMRTLDVVAGRAGVGLHLVGAPSSARRIAELLPFRSLRIGRG